MAGKAEGGRLKGEGKLTDKMLQQKLQRGKGPLLNLGAALSNKGRDPEAIRRGVR